MLFAAVGLKLFPVSTTLAPTCAFTGENVVITGGAPYVKPDCIAVPYPFVTTTLPDAPAPTVAVMLVGEFTVNDAAGIPPNETAVAPDRLLPVIVTIVPEVPNVGLNE